jgi:hypothetical protein
MKMRRLLVIAYVCCLSTAVAQLRSVTAYGSYSTALSRQSGFSTVRGFGGGVQAHLTVVESIGVNLYLGYERFSTIKQDSALERWNWRFWNERYAGNVRIDTLADTLKAVLTPVQYMEVIPLMIAVSYDWQPSERLWVRPSIGGGVLFYTRSLYVDERWRKRFESAGYTFEYTFRNFAPDKKGNPFAVAGGLDLSYRVFNALALSTQARFTSVLKTPGYEQFPIKSSLSLSFGLSFLY